MTLGRAQGPSLSFVVPSYDMAPYLELTLESLQRAAKRQSSRVARTDAEHGGECLDDANEQCIFRSLAIRKLRKWSQTRVSLGGFVLERSVDPASAFFGANPSFVLRARCRIAERKLHGFARALLHPAGIVPRRRNRLPERYLVRTHRLVDGSRDGFYG